MDSQQKELIGRAHLEMRLLQNGFEVASPARDRGIDLIAYSDEPGKPFQAVPIQMKAATKRSFAVERKYERRGIVFAYVWHILETPRLFLVPYKEAVALLPESSRQRDTWKNKGKWNISRPSKALATELLAYEDNFDVLRNAMSQMPASL